MYLIGIDPAALDNWITGHYGEDDVPFGYDEDDDSDPYCPLCEGDLSESGDCPRCNDDRTEDEYLGLR